MLVLIGASASGKTEVARQLVLQYGMNKIITYTTRPMRHGESNHKDYHFIDGYHFDTLKQQNFFLETTSYQGHQYGTALEDANENTVIIVDPSGANAIYESIKDRVVIVLIQSPHDVRKKRMLKRGDLEEVIAKRLKSDEATFDPSQLNHVDLIIENTNTSLDVLVQTIYRFYKKCLNSQSS